MQDRDHIVFSCFVQIDVLGSVAKLVSERDNALRQAVLGTMEALYCCEGDGAYMYVFLVDLFHASD